MKKQRTIRKKKQMNPLKTTRRKQIKQNKPLASPRIHESIPLDSYMGQALLSRNEQSLSVVITVHNEAANMRKIIDMVLQLKPKEAIVVENGSTDRTLEICKEYPVRCCSYSNRLGHDVGRAIGAKAATGEVLLFLDGDFPIDPSLLLPFVKCCYDGADVALNHLDPFYKNATFIDYASMAKFYLNDLLLRRDLGFCSLTAIPHAMTKKAALAIGIENLAVPPKALAIAVYKGLRVEKSATVDVFHMNKLRPYHHEIGEMILGDHIEAIQWLQERTSSRVNLAGLYKTRPQTSKRGLKIVHVMSNAPAAYPLPPFNQGGTEKVFYDLTEELVHRGHDVYVFAPKGSTCSAKVIEFPPDLSEKDIGSFVASRLPSPIDVINDFTFTSSVKRLKLPVPTVSTHQCPLGWSTSKSIYPSKRMWDTVGKQRGYIVYNGIHPDDYEYEEEKKDYLLFIGRIVREKGVLEAIRVAEKTNHKLIIAGPIKDSKLFAEAIEPVLKRNANIEYVGAVGGKSKQELFKNAKCVLFPITWEEPFGLVMIEALMTGTPVLAFPQGSVPEVLAGFPQLICHNIEEMMQKVTNAAFPSAAQLRQYVTDRFSRQTMAEQYVKIYESIRKSGRKSSRRRTSKKSAPAKPVKTRQRKMTRKVTPKVTRKNTSFKRKTKKSSITTTRRVRNRRSSTKAKVRKK